MILVESNVRVSFSFVPPLVPVFLQQPLSTSVPPFPPFFSHHCYFQAWLTQSGKLARSHHCPPRQEKQVALKAAAFFQEATHIPNTVFACNAHVPYPCTWPMWSLSHSHIQKYLSELSFDLASIKDGHSFFLKTLFLDPSPGCRPPLPQPALGIWPFHLSFDC